MRDSSKPPTRPRSRTFVIWVLALVVAGASYGNDSAAERVARWRAALDVAEAAAVERRWAAAEAAVATVISEADTADRRGLLYVRAIDLLGDVRRGEGRGAEAATLYATAIPLWERVLGPGQPRIAVTLHNLGATRLELGDAGEAAVAFRRALSIFASTLGPESTEAQGTNRGLLLAERQAAAQRAATTGSE